MSIITGDSLAFDGVDDAIRYCRDLGIITTGNPIQFANPIIKGNHHAHIDHRLFRWYQSGYCPNELVSEYRRYAKYGQITGRIYSILSTQR